MMSDMKTFTVRDLDREPSTVLEACDRDGEARIRRRDGRVYRLTPEREPERTITHVPDFLRRAKKIFPKMLTESQVKMVDEAIRGDGASF